MKMKESLYSTYKDGKYIGDFTSSELNKMIGIKPSTLYSYISNGYPYRNYSFQKKSEGTMTIEQFRSEWDRVRKLLNPNAV